MMNYMVVTGEGKLKLALQAVVQKDLSFFGYSLRPKMCVRSANEKLK